MVTRFDRETLPGYVSPQTYLQDTGLELLTPEGTVSLLPYSDVKLVCFVREFGQGEPRRELRLFTARPKLQGLWVRMKFRDGDLLDGILPNNLLLLDRTGFTVVPPDPNFQNQRLFVPKSALAEMAVLGVVGTARATRKPVQPATKEQLEMFGKHGD
ncbi:MAG: hypothetical protein JO022_00180 [Acidobacteriaceae bacterium]|nr:hypothetical protein [Acidobacteriaceae bacterium]